MVKDVVLVGMEILEKNFSVARSGSDLEVAYVMVVELLSCLQLTMLIDFSQDSDVVAKCGSTAPATLINIAAWMVHGWCHAGQHGHLALSSNRRQ